MSVLAAWPETTPIMPTEVPRIPATNPVSNHDLAVACPRTLNDPNSFQLSRLKSHINIAPTLLIPKTKVKKMVSKTTPAKGANHFHNQDSSKDF